jgi:Ca2+-binding RTX toxin-like protein
MVNAGAPPWARVRPDVWECTGLLALLGLFGAVMAGLAADAVLFSRKEDDEDEGSDLSADEEEAGHYGDLLSDRESEEGVPLSDDIPDPVDAPVTLQGGGGADNLSGLGNDDHIYGKGGSDLIDGRAGDDWIDTDEGNDAVWAGDGDDTVWGDEGNDSLIGQAGNDALQGGAGNDSLAGWEGDDSLVGDAGNDTLIGGEGDDWLAGEGEDDWLAGGYGHDSLTGGAGADVLDGNAGNDALYGFEADGDRQETDFLNGGTGDDRLFLGAGDHATGGEGADEFTLDKWLNETGVSQIADYNPAEDQLVIVYDPTIHTDPVLTAGPDAAGHGQAIYLDGAKVAIVSGAPVDLADIRLVTG